MAADDAGCWISTGKWLLRIDPAGRLHRVVPSALADVATGGGAVWLPRMSSVLRVDERTGKVRVLRTGRLGLGGFQHDVAVGHGSLWALSSGRSVRSSSASTRATATAPVKWPCGVPQTQS